MIKGCDYQQADTAGRMVLLTLVFFASIGVCTLLNFVRQMHTRFVNWYARADGYNQQPNSRKEQ